MRATSRAGSALAATTLAAFFALGDAAEVTVKISYPDRDAGSTAARVLVATLVTLAVSMLVWMVLRRSASSTTRTSTSTTTAEQDVVNEKESDGWEVLTSDDDEEDTTAGAPTVGGHERSAEGQAGSSAASGERSAVARRAGEAYYPEQRGGVRVVPWIKCSQCTDGYMYLECPKCGAEVCSSCSSRCERCQMEECNHCGLHHDYRCRFRRVANGDAITRSKLRHFEGVEAARASARQVAPRLEDSLRLDAVTVPLSPAEKWLEDFVMLFRCDALQIELKRRGHSPTGLKQQLARRLVRDGSTNAVSTESIWRLAALEAVSRTGRESSGRHRASILAALETEQSLVSYLQSRE